MAASCRQETTEYGMRHQGALFDLPNQEPRKVGLTTGRERDSQRSKVYVAERRAFPQFETQLYQRSEHCREFVAKVVGAGWFRSRWDVVAVDVRFRETANAKGHPSGWIQLPRWGYNPWVILHELSHVVVRGCAAGHGPEFCAAYLELVRNGLGEASCNALRREFLCAAVAHNVERRKVLVDRQKAEIVQLKGEIARMRALIPANKRKLEEAMRQ